MFCLQVFEDGILTDALGNAIDFKNAIIIMTQISALASFRRKPRWVFRERTTPRERSWKKMVMSSVRQTFNPEFINRLDEIIIFDELFNHELLDVIQLQSNRLTGP